MSSIQICQRYAKSLYSLAQDQGVVEEVYACLQSLGQIIEQSADLRDFLGNPLLAQSERQKVIAAVFSGKVPALVEKFLYFINQKNRLNRLRGIIDAFDALYLQAHNRLRAQVQVALPLELSVKEQILAQLSRKYGKDVLASWQIRQEILGGFRILIEGYLHDYSFTDQLNKYRQEVLG